MNLRNVRCNGKNNPYFVLHIPFHVGPSLKKPIKFELSGLISFNFSFIEIRFWRQNMRRSKLDAQTYIQTDTYIQIDTDRQTDRQADIQTDILIIFLACVYLYSLWKEHTNLCCRLKANVFFTFGVRSLLHRTGNCHTNLCKYIQQPLSAQQTPPTIMTICIIR
jgi:hypothetical protein